MSELFKCSGCMRVARPAECFVGKNGQQVKTCNECRAKDAKQSAKPEVRERKNAFQKGKDYSAKHRAKKRAEDEKGFLEHNPKVMAEYMSRPENRERANKRLKLSVANRLCSLKYQAAKKGYAWELTGEQEVALVKGTCFYCGSTTKDAVNGIDRMDSKGTYTLANCVSSCCECNLMKGCLDAGTFVERCGQVSVQHGGPGEVTDAWRDTQNVTFNTYKHTASKKELAFELSESDFDCLVSGPCKYCGRASTGRHQNGIDRLDSSAGYMMENCATCCGECNVAKKTMSAEAFVEKCKVVSGRAASLDIPAMPRCLSVISKR